MAGCQGAWYLSSEKWHMMVGKPLQSTSSNHPQIYREGRLISALTLTLMLLSLNTTSPSSHRDSEF